MPAPTSITFGTDGWRAEIAREFTFDNVGLVAQAVADHLNATGKGSRGVFVGYDARFLSDRFAAHVADVLGANGVPALLPERDCPTPVAVYAVKERGLAGAVIVTASHNPPEQNGVKFVPDTLHPALPQTTDDLSARVRALQDQPSRVRTGGPPPAVVDPRPGYSAHLGELFDFAALGAAGLTLCVDPLYGSGRGYLCALLRDAGCTVHTLHDHRDPLFGGGTPEPTPRNLAPLVAQVRETGARLGLALDGDADRFGVVDPTGHVLSGNDVFALALLHWARTRGASGPVVRSVTTSGMIDSLAGHLGVDVIETPVGFKWVGYELLTRDGLIGGEESGGLSARGHIPEKDGIFADLLITEMVATTVKSPCELLAEVKAITGDFYRARLDFRLPPDEQYAVIVRLAAAPPDSLAGAPVVSVSTVDGVKMVRADGSWLLVRPGGTEPVLRAFVEGRTPEAVEQLKAAAWAFLPVPAVGDK